MLKKNYNFISRYSSAGSMLIGLAVLLGWVLNVGWLRTLHLGTSEMVPLTAINIIFLSLSILLSHSSKNHKSHHFKTLAIVFASIPICMALITLLEHVTKYDFGIRKIFFFDQLLYSPGVLFQGNMSVQTSVLCLLIGSMILFRNSKKNDSNLSILQSFPIFTVGICLLALVGFIHEITFSKLIGISMPTALSFTLLSIGSLGLGTNQGMLAAYRSNRSDGFFLRWFTVFSIFIPIAFSAVIQFGQKRYLYPPEFSLALLVIFCIASLFILGLFLAKAISSLENQRIFTEQAASRAALLESEESLQKTKDRLEFALAASKMGIWDISFVNRKLNLSRAAAQMLGHANFEGTAPLEDFYIGMHPDDAIDFKRIKKQALEEKIFLEADLRMSLPQEKVRWLRFKGRAEYNCFGEALNMGGTVLDVTNEKSYQETLESALRAAESASELKTTFLTNMSHEIRTPLAAILGFTELLKEPNLTEQEKSKYVDIISKNGKSLSYLLNDILDLSKVEAGHLNIEMVQFRVPDIVDEVFTLLQGSADAKHISLEVEYQSQCSVPIVSDPSRLKQILVNLVGNAIKFTTKGSVKTLVYCQDKHLHFEIQDTGIGISEDQRAKLFRAFSQADDSTTRRFGGTGLGLLLSQRLASLLGGNLILKDSAPNVGSNFSFCIENHYKKQTESTIDSAVVAAIAPCQSPIFEEVQNKKRRKLENLQILLTDDSSDNQELISRMLTREGAQVDFANNGQECIEKAFNKNYDLILMDIQMPVMDGYTAASKLRDLRFQQPIIALTAHAMGEVRKKCESLGFDEHLAKPLDRTKLIQTIAILARQNFKENEFGGH